MKVTVTDYDDPFDTYGHFSDLIKQHTNAPFVVLTDCCTHALELSLRYLQQSDSIPEEISIPKQTYLSVPMTLYKLGIKYSFNDYEWVNEYSLHFTNIWDSARNFNKDMYISGQIQCISFGHTKPLEIGRGGCILLDDKNMYDWLSKAAYDGRDISIKPWANQKKFDIGFHYMMRPEECVIGINKILENDIDNTKQFSYPDLSQLDLPTII